MPRPRASGLMAGLREMQRPLRMHGGCARQGIDGRGGAGRGSGAQDAGHRLAGPDHSIRFRTPGLLILGCGQNSIRFCPALTASPDEIGRVSVDLRGVRQGGRRLNDRRPGPPFMLIQAMPVLGAPRDIEADPRRRASARSLRRRRNDRWRRRPESAAGAPPVRWP